MQPESKKGKSGRRREKKRGERKREKTTLTLRLSEERKGEERINNNKVL